jgi:uncharacterized repeat protein (TIGR03803 family)
LHIFTSKAGGQNPYGSLIMDSVGNLYGTTSTGGIGSGGGEGIVYELSPTESGPWAETVLWALPNLYVYGQTPRAGLVFDSAGNLYGTSYYGGLYYGGTVYEVSPNGDGTWTGNTLWSFYGYPISGSNPTGNLVFDSAGNLYGTTSNSGSSLSDEGTVFELSLAGGVWNETDLFTFTTPATQGGSPTSGFVFDASGNLYGTTSTGGTGNGGTVFEITP